MKVETENPLEICFPRKVETLIIQAPYYKEISENLLFGATDYLDTHGIPYDVMDVPGALEVPALLKFIQDAPKQYDAFVVLGCVIRGESYHFEIVCNETMRKIYDLVERYDLALGNGILTVESEQQAKDRSEKQGRNNGREAAIAAMAMLNHKFELCLIK